MIIRFTDHARIRCVQRNISEKWLVARLLRIPFNPSPYQYRQHLDNTNIFVVFKDGSTFRSVITVYLAIELQEKPKADVSKHTKDTRVRDMVNKALGKSRKRVRRKGGKRWK